MNSLVEWISFNSVLVLLLIGNILFHKKEKKITAKESVLWTSFWIFLALLFAIYLYVFHGKIKTFEFMTGYLVEKLLSLDNLFVFLLIFQTFKTPASLYHHVLFWGILGAIVLRAGFIFAGVAILQAFHFTIYLFGAFLIYLAIKFTFFEQKEVHPEKNLLVRVFIKFFPIKQVYQGKKFFIKQEGRLFATLLFIVLIAVESADLVFALDSVPAILAITQDPFIVYTSIIFAMLGLRSLFFLIASISEKMRFFHYAMGIILAIVGIKMLLSGVYDLPIYLVLASVVAIFAFFAILSFLIHKKIS